MKYATVDSIVRRTLLEKSMPIHYYFEYLIHATSCIRELSIDTLKIINTVQLPVDSMGSVQLPDDFCDDVAVSLNNGGAIRKLPHQHYLSPVRVHNETTGAFEQQVTNADKGVDAALFFGSGNWTWFWNVNDYGEPTGRRFGLGGGSKMGYEVFAEQRRIQMSGGFENGSIILMYVSDGQSLNNVTQIDIKAIATIQSWIDWKSNSNVSANELSYEGRAYYSKKKALRARMNDLTIEDIKNIVRNSYRATLKN